MNELEIKTVTTPIMLFLVVARCVPPTNQADKINKIHLGTVSRAAISSPLELHVRGKARNTAVATIGLTLTRWQFSGALHGAQLDSTNIEIVNGSQ